MLYQFKCEKHGKESIHFEVSQPIMAEHEADCPVCGALAQRIFSVLQWIWGGSVYRPDGSLREQNDYAILKG